MKHNISLKYKNILARPLEKKDTEILRQWRNDSSNAKFLRKVGYITEEQQADWYNKYLVNADEYIFAIDEVQDLNRIVGSASLYEFDNGQVEFGKILIGDDEAHGRKIGCNTTKALVSIAFEHFNCTKVILHCFTANISACRVYMQAGFKEVNKYITDDGYEEVLMELIKKDFVLGGI